MPNGDEKVTEDPEVARWRRDVEDLADRVDALSRELVDGAPPMVVDAIAEAWFRGLPSAVGDAALVMAARRGRTIVCCPLGQPEPTAAILPNDVTPGMSADRVRRLIGDPDHETADGEETTWLHALPFAGREDDEPDGIAYPLRQAAWPRADASPQDPPFAPLVAGERLFRVTSFTKGRVTTCGVTVGQDFDDDPTR